MLVKRLLVRFWRVPVEAIALLGFTTLPLALAEFWLRVQMTEDELGRSSFAAGILERFSYSDIFVFATGVIGSSALFFLLRPRYFIDEFRLVGTAVILPFVVIFIASLVGSAVNGVGLEPNSFLSDFANGTVVLMGVAWLILLIEQQVQESREIDITGAGKALEMGEKAKDKIG